MTIAEDSISLHKKLRGKISIYAKRKIKSKRDLSLLYTPGVGAVCKEIAQQKELIFSYTSRWNLVAVLTDGSAILGLGNLGPEAALPVMEGKAILFKEFGGVDAFPICLKTQVQDEIIQIAEALEPSLGGINLEDISAPRCFEIEATLKERLHIPVFHDDQHGTAIVALAALINACKITTKNMTEAKIVINGAGSAGIAIAKFFYNWGCRNLIICDSKGIIAPQRTDLNKAKQEILTITNPDKITGSLQMALKGSDVFIGVSSANLLTAQDIRSMAKEPIVFALANPDPEITPAEARCGGAAIIATGRSDFPNQINNVLAFPGIFRGALDVEAEQINEEMKLAAAQAIADLVSTRELDKGIVVPSALDRSVGLAVGLATARAASKSGVARLKLNDNELKAKIKKNLKL